MLIIIKCMIIEMLMLINEMVVIIEMLMLIIEVVMIIEMLIIIEIVTMVKIFCKSRICWFNFLAVCCFIISNIVLTLQSFLAVAKQTLLFFWPILNKLIYNIFIYNIL